MQMRFNRLLKNCASGRHSALRGSRQCSHMLEYAALVALPHALPDGLILVFQQPFNGAFLKRSHALFNNRSSADKKQAHAATRIHPTIFPVPFISHLNHFFIEHQTVHAPIGMIRLECLPVKEIMKAGTVNCENRCLKADRPVDDMVFKQSV